MNDFSSLLAKAHSSTYELVDKVMIQVDTTLTIGLNRLNWFSKDADAFFRVAEQKISSMSDFLSQISSFIFHRIEQPLIEVSRFDILEFPDHSIDLKSFVEEVRQQIVGRAEKLNLLSIEIESAVLHVIKMFLDRAGYQSKPFEIKLADISKKQEENYS